MKCDRCGINESALLIKQNINGKESEMHLCSSCAKSLGMDAKGFAGFGTIPVSMLQGSIFSALDHMSKSANVNTGVFIPGRSAGLVCKSCGLELTEFREKGKLGCTKCYEVFGQQLDQVFRRIQSGESHRGRRIAEDPQSIEIRTALEEISELKSKIGVAVQHEDYEKAAKYKTEIEKLNIRINEIKSAETSSENTGNNLGDGELK